MNQPAIPPVTVIIPTLNEAAQLPRLLGQLADGGALIARVVVSDGGSTDATATIAAARGALVLHGPSGRGGQIARGVAAAPHGWVLLLHADSILPDDWTDRLPASLATAAPRRAYFGRLKFATNDPRARMAEALVWLRCALFRLPYGDQGLLIHHDLLDGIGGMPELQLMEDVALARRLGRRRLAPMRLTIATDPGAYRRDGWLRRPARNLVRLLRFLAGTPADRLARGYRR